MNELLSEEQQQIEAIKSWIKEHFLSLLAAIVIFCAIVFGPDLYQSYKNSKIFPASDTYEQFNQAVVQASSGNVATDSELQLVDRLADLLVEQYGDTQYAFLASLNAAKLSADLGNYQAALSRLQWAESNTGNQADQQLVNYRLAMIEAQLGETASALARLDKANEHFGSLYAEARGDIHNGLGNRAQAVEAYQQALSLLTSRNNSQSDSIQFKLNDLLSGLGSLKGQ